MPSAGGLVLAGPPSLLGQLQALRRAVRLQLVQRPAGYCLLFRPESQRTAVFTEGWFGVFICGSPAPNLKHFTHAEQLRE